MSARFVEVSVLPSLATALDTITRRTPRSSWTWWSVAARRRYCSTASGGSSGFTIKCESSDPAARTSAGRDGRRWPGPEHPAAARRPARGSDHWLTSRARVRHVAASQRQVDRSAGNVRCACTFQCVSDTAHDDLRSWDSAGQKNENFRFLVKLPNSGRSILLAFPPSAAMPLPVPASPGSRRAVTGPAPLTECRLGSERGDWDGGVPCRDRNRRRLPGSVRR